MKEIISQLIVYIVPLRITRRVLNIIIFYKDKMLLATNIGIKQY